MDLRRHAPKVVALALTASVVAGCSLFDPQRNLTLREVMDAKHDGLDTSTQAQDITESACGSTLDCVEAYSTAEADYFKFKSRERAAEYGATVKDGFVVNSFVMDFTGKDASVERQLWAMQVLAGMWNDYEGDFPDRD